MWYDNSRLLSYNAILNFVLGNRGGGKSFNAKKWAINDFLKKGKQFIYVRRYKEELKKVDLFFDDIKHLYPNNKFEVRGRVALIDNKICGYFIPLSTSQKEKSTAYPNVNKIIFDEFLVDKGHIRYLRNEVEVMLDLIETVQRLRDDVRVVFLANNVSSVNPYFTYFKIRLNPNERFTICHDGLIVVEVFTDQEYINQKNKTRFGKLVSSTKWGEYAINNKSLRDSDNFILEHKPKKSVFLFSMKMDGKEYGVWSCKEEGFLYINYQIDNSSYRRYTLISDQHEPNYYLIRSLKSCREIKQLIECFDLGLVRFYNQEIKLNIFEIMGMFNSR